MRPAFGAKQVTALAVTQDSASYQLRFRIHGSQGMSFSRKTSLIGFTLPTDGMPVELYGSDRHTRAIPFHGFDGGVIGHGAIDPRPQ